MNMKLSRLLGVAAIAVLAACTNDPALKSNNLGVPSNFYQLELNGKSFVINLFTPWADHPIINQSPPVNGGTLGTDIGTFMTATAGRSTAIATQTTNLLLSSNVANGGVLVADLSQTGNASFLGVETGGKLNWDGTVCATPPCTPVYNSATGVYTGGGNVFGGRAPQEDLGAQLLGIAYGPTIPEIFTSIPDDGKEQTGANGTPILSNDNVPFGQGPGIESSFPYLQVPH
jgi:hypothetical protein